MLVRAGAVIFWINLESRTSRIRRRLDVSCEAKRKVKGDFSLALTQNLNRQNSRGAYLGDAGKLRAEFGMCHG